MANPPRRPSPATEIFEKVQNLIVGSNRLAVDAAAQQARALGYHTLVLSTFIEGETRDVARVHAAIAKEIRATGRPVKPSGLRDFRWRDHCHDSRLGLRRT